MSDVVSAAERNIGLLYVSNFFISVFLCVSVAGPFFEKYVFNLAELSGLEPNWTVGLAESVFGIASLAVFVPVGYLVDRFSERRAFLCKISALICSVAVVMFELTFALDRLFLLFCTMTFMGLIYELLQSASEALFADSAEIAKRDGTTTKYFTNKSVATFLGAAAAPIIQIALTDYHNAEKPPIIDETNGKTLVNQMWGMSLLHFVLTLGVVFMVPALVILLTLRETQRIDNTELEKRLLANPNAVTRSPYFHYVPYLLATSDFVSCLGAGMTIKYMNLYFIQTHNFGPVAISYLQVSFPCMVAVFTLSYEALARKFGRIKVSFTSGTLVMVGMFCMGYLLGPEDIRPDNLQRDWANDQFWLWLEIVCYVVSGAAGMSSPTLDKSLLMEHIVQEKRGMWNAVLSFNGFSWRGSAFIGGYIADSNGGSYILAFKIAFWFQLLALAVYAPLFWIVQEPPPKEKDIIAEITVTPSKEKV